MQKLIFGSLLLTGFNAQLHAQETVQNFPDLVVTATRTETAKNQLAAAATVYTRKDIERLQAKTGC
jgi:vitamin B12 transporter